MTQPLLFGFHVRSLEELIKVLEAGANVIELKPYHMALSGFPLYEYFGDPGHEGSRFKINKTNAKEIRKLTKNCQVQIHIPYEESATPDQEVGLCQTLERHQKTILQRFDLIEKLRTKYGIGKVVTMHPGLFRYIDHEHGPVKILSEEKALEANKEFFQTIDPYFGNRWNFKLGVENVTEPKDLHASLGYTTKQLRFLLDGTSNLGLTIDTGHRNLTNELSVKELMSKFPVFNMHLHMNRGKPDPTSFRDDTHDFAGQENLPHFYNYAKAIRRHEIPVICEVDTFSISAEDLADYRTYTMMEILSQ